MPNLNLCKLIFYLWINIKKKYTKKGRIGAMRKHVTSVTTTSIKLEIHMLHILVDVSLLFPKSNTTFVKSI